MQTKKKKPKMTYDQCVEFAKSLQPFDMFFVQSGDLTGAMIQWATGNRDGFDANHVGIYLGEGIGRTLEADGKAVEYHLISDYFPKLQSGDTRLKIYRINALTVPETEDMKVVVKAQYKKPYSQVINGFFGVWGIVNKIIPAAGWLMGKLRNPGVKHAKDGSLENYVCSISACEVWLGNKRVKPTLLDKALENRTPENLFNSVNNSPVAGQAVDTLAIAYNNA